MVEMFPLAQFKSLLGPFHLPRMLWNISFKTANRSTGPKTHGLSVVSMAWFFVMLAVAWRTTSQVGASGWWPAFLVVVLTGPFLYYGNVTWGEMLVASLLVCFTASALLPIRPLLIAVAAFLAGLTKETAFPFLLAIGLLSLWIARERAPWEYVDMFSE